MLTPPNPSPAPDGGYGPTTPQIHGFGPGGAVTGYGGPPALGHLFGGGLPGAHHAENMGAAQQALNIFSIIHNLLGGGSGAALGSVLHAFPHPGPSLLGGAFNGFAPTHDGVGTNFVPSAPQLPAGTYTGAYAAQGLRTSDPYSAAQLWESRHPAAVHEGHVPHWVTQALTHAIRSHLAATQAPPPAPPVPTNQAQ